MSLKIVTLTLTFKVKFVMRMQKKALTSLVVNFCVVYDNYLDAINTVLCVSKVEVSTVLLNLPKIVKNKFSLIHCNKKMSLEFKKTISFLWNTHIFNMEKLNYCTCRVKQHKSLSCLSL